MKHLVKRHLFPSTVCGKSFRAGKASPLRTAEECRACWVAGVLSSWRKHKVKMLPRSK
jgi:hypothetical protein